MQNHPEIYKLLKKIYIIPVSHEKRRIQMSDHRILCWERHLEDEHQYKSSTRFLNLQACATGTPTSYLQHGQCRSNICLHELHQSECFHNEISIG